MARKKLIKNQTKQEMAFEMASKMLGKPATSADCRFYMKLTKIVEDDSNFRLKDVAELYTQVYEINIEI